MTTRKTPVFFISHGGPNLLEDEAKPGAFYTWFGNYIKHELKPKAIVIISAHWQGNGKNGINVDISEKPKLIYDFYNFPQRYYEQTWDHRGEPNVASRVIELLNKAGIEGTGETYGNDHGVWVPLKRAMQSNPDIPVVEVSTFDHEDMAMHTKLGEALAPLRDQGILIIGSGAAVHNLRELRRHIDAPSPDFVYSFDKEIDESVCTLTGDDRKTAVNRLDKHPNFRQCHPTAEHLTPLHVAVGAAGQDLGIKLLDDRFSTLSWGSFAFGLPDDVTLPKYQTV